MLGVGLHRRCAFSLATHSPASSVTRTLTLALTRTPPIIVTVPPHPHPLQGFLLPPSWCAVDTLRVAIRWQVPGAKKLQVREGVGALHVRLGGRWGRGGGGACWDKGDHCDLGMWGAPTLHSLPLPPPSPPLPPLQSLREAYGLPAMQAHRALPDAVLAVEVLAAMLRQRSGAAGAAAGAAGTAAGAAGAGGGGGWRGGLVPEADRVRAACSAVQQVGQQE